jgi:hypothetical protein
MNTPHGSHIWNRWFRSLSSLLAQLMEGDGQRNFVSHRA